MCFEASVQVLEHRVDGMFKYIRGMYEAEESASTVIGEIA